MSINEPGTLHSLDGRMSPDIQTAFHIYAAHWRKVDPKWTYPEHTHPMFEINVVLEGRQQMLVGNKNYTQAAGEIVFIRPGVPHSSHVADPEHDMTYYCMHFDINDLALRRALLKLDVVSLSGDTPEKQAFRRALDHVIRAAILTESGNVQRNRLVALQASLQLFAALSGWVLAETSDAAPSMLTGVTENTVALAHAVEGLLQESVFTAAATQSRGGWIEEIAARLGYTPNHCNRAFRQIYGMSPRQYLSDLTIRHAKLLLLDNTLSVDTIAHRLGYRDVSHFSKQFKRWTGMPPMGYRRNAEEPSGSFLG